MATKGITAATPDRGQSWIDNTRWWQRKSVQRQLRLGVSTAILIIGAFAMLVPIFWMISASLKDEGDIFIIPIQWLPDPVRWRNYPEALTFQPFWLYFRNSV